MDPLSLNTATFFFRCIEAFRDHISVAYNNIRKYYLQDIINKNNTIQKTDISGFYYNGIIYANSPIKGYLAPPLDESLIGELETFNQLELDNNDNLEKICKYLFSLDDSFIIYRQHRATQNIYQCIRDFLPEIFLQFKHIEDTSTISFDNRRIIRSIPEKRSDSSPVDLPEEINDLLDIYIGYKVIS